MTIGLAFVVFLFPPAQSLGGPSARVTALRDLGAVHPFTVNPVLTGPAWTVDGEQEAAAMGRSVATAGDVNGDGFSDVIVGAFRYDNGQTYEGRAYLYLGSATGLSASPS